MLLPQCSLAFFSVILMRNYAGIGQRIDAPPRNITASGHHTVPELRAVLFIGRAELVEISLAGGLDTRTVGGHVTGPDQHPETDCKHHNILIHA